MSKKILVTGGLGFIGSHLVTALVGSGCRVCIVDDLRNSRIENFERLKKIVGLNVDFSNVNVLCEADLSSVFDKFRPDAVIHLAAEKSPAESIANPVKYFRNNIMGLCNVLDSMDQVDCQEIVFSSSATVYGIPDKLPITEDMPTRPTNPYGRSKLYGERLLRDWCECSATRRAVSLRYFNPVGAHPSGLIGENPEKAENIFPKIFDSITANVPLKIYGDDYDTRDGTGERDFIHVMDLAEAHALVVLGLENQTGCDVFNIGTGVGTTVFELVRMMRWISGHKIPLEIIDRRPGDVASAFADAKRIHEKYGWAAKYDLEMMCRDAWNWTKSF